MVGKLEPLGFQPLQFRLDNHRPDLVKLSNLLGLLSKEAVGFAEEVDSVEKVIREEGLNQALEKLKVKE